MGMLVVLYHSQTPSSNHLIALPQTLIFFDVKMYWKSYGNWPSKMLSKEDIWPPVGMYYEKNLLSVDAAFLFEAAPHDDAGLSKLGIPKMGVRVAIYNLKIIRIPQMLMDLAWSLLNAVGVSADFGV